MRQTEKGKRIRKGTEIAILALLCAITLLLDFIRIPFSDDAFYNRIGTKILQQACGCAITIWLARRLKLRIFRKAENWLYLLPCILIALDNFQWSSYASGKMQLVRSGTGDMLLFLASCMFVGLFEELIFRGILFSLLLGVFSKDQKGFLKTYIYSSLIFGAAHLFNGFSLGTLLQVVYTCLTGGLFAFCFVKTKNVLCCAFVHGLYNFCGTLFDKQGLGTGVVFDLGTVITMLVVSVSVGIFVLYKIWKYPSDEREKLYERLAIEK